MKKLLTTIFLMVTVCAYSQGWNEPNYNPYFFGTASIHVTPDTLYGVDPFGNPYILYPGYVGFYDTLDFYHVQLGDKIGFFDSEGLCCGYNQIVDWNNLGISLVGDIPSTPEKEGFYEGDTMYLKIYSFSLRESFDCDFVSYMASDEEGYNEHEFINFIPPNKYPIDLSEFYFTDGLFHNTGLYVIDSLTCYVPFERHYISLNRGWDGISSYLIPVNRDVEVMFEGVPLVCLKKGGQSYMPGDHNNMGYWQPDKGYQINVSDTCTVKITGLEIMDKVLELDAGWHIIPVLSKEPVLCDFDISGEYDLIRDFSVSIYWPYENITSLKYLIPGKAYKVHLDTPFIFDFGQDNFTGIREFKKKEPKTAILHEGKIFINGFDLNGKRYEKRH